MTNIVTVYKSGNSQVITIPASLGLKEGDQFKLKKSSKNITLTKKNKENINKKLETLKKLSGTAPGSAKGLDKTERLNEFLEGIYE